MDVYWESLQLSLTNTTIPEININEVMAKNSAYMVAWYILFCEDETKNERIVKLRVSPVSPRITSKIDEILCLSFTMQLLNVHRTNPIVPMVSFNVSRSTVGMVLTTCVLIFFV
jgi:hypothetical protein